jgi:hypothetical protein
VRGVYTGDSRWGVVVPRGGGLPVY